MGRELVQAVVWVCDWCGAVSPVLHERAASGRVVIAPEEASWWRVRGVDGKLVCPVCWASWGEPWGEGWEAAV